MAALYRGPKKGYRLTDQDRLMLALSLRGENGRTMTEREAGAVAWSMMMRYMLVNYRWMEEGWTFERFVQGFSQPVNPTWAYPSEARMRNHPEACIPEKLAWRRKLQSFNWEQISINSPDAVKYAQMFTDGKLPNPFLEKVYDFAACRLIHKQHRNPNKRPGTGVNIGGNCFLRYYDLNIEEREDVIPGKVSVGLGAHFGSVSLGAIFLFGGAVLYAWRYFAN